MGATTASLVSEFALPLLRATLAPEAHHRALDMNRGNAVDVVYWPTPDPTVATFNGKAGGEKKDGEGL